MKIETKPVEQVSPEEAVTLDDATLSQATSVSEAVALLQTFRSRDGVSYCERRALDVTDIPDVCRGTHFYDVKADEFVSDKSWRYCRMVNCDFEDQAFLNVNLSTFAQDNHDFMTEKQFQDVVMPARLENCSFRNSSFDETTDFSGREIIDCDFRNAYLFGASFKDARVSGDFRGANLTGCDLRGAVFFDALLEGADLRGADTTGALFPPGFDPEREPEFGSVDNADELEVVAEEVITHTPDPVELLRDDTHAETYLGELQADEAALCAALDLVMPETGRIYAVVRLQESDPPHAHFVYGIRCSDDELVLVSVDNEVAVNGIYLDATMLVNLSDKSVTVLDSIVLGDLQDNNWVLDVANDLDVATRSHPQDCSKILNSRGHLLVERSLEDKSITSITELKNHKEHELFPMVTGLLRGGSEESVRQIIAENEEEFAEVLSIVL